MNKELPVKFIREKIQELQSALVFPETNAIVKIPNYVINAAQTDDQGNIWFTICRPALYMEKDEWQFDCRLDFFKKGLDFHMKVYGIATIISNGCELDDVEIPAGLPQPLKGAQEVAIRVAISYADYFELPPLKVENPTADESLQLGGWLNKLLQPGQRVIKENVRLELMP